MSEIEQKNFSFYAKKIFNNKPILICIVTLTLLLTILLRVSYTHQAQSSRVFDVVTIANSNHLIGALFSIAQEKGYFLENNLNVIILPFSSGKKSLDAIFKNRADFSFAADTPISLAILAKKPIQIYATIGSTNKSIGLLVKKNLNFKPSMLINKKIGVTKGTNAEYFLQSYLLKYGISKKHLKIVNIPPNKIEDALVNNKVDAICTWDPKLIRLNNSLNKRFQIIMDENIYSWTWNLIGKKDSDGDVVKKILNALIKAEEYYIKFPKHVSEIIAKVSNLTKEDVNALIKANEYEVGLDQTLIVNLENQIDWFADSETSKDIDVLDNINYGPLENIRAGSVGIIR